MSVTSCAPSPFWREVACYVDWAPDVPQFEGVPEEDCQHGVWPFYGFGVKQSRINGLSFAALFLDGNSTNTRLLADSLLRNLNGPCIEGIAVSYRTER